MHTILIVDDDPSLCRNLSVALTASGYRTLTASDAASACRQCSDADLILLDVMLPDDSGYDCCREIRRKTDVPLLFLTSCSDEAEIIRGLDCGGDDYITKPFRLRELLARIQANLRRCEPHAPQSTAHIGPELTAAEQQLLDYLKANAGQYVSREQILAALWDAKGSFVSDNTLSVHISRLREKLEAAHCGEIRTKRGMGYKWVGAAASEP